MTLECIPKGWFCILVAAGGGWRGGCCVLFRGVVVSGFLVLGLFLVLLGIRSLPSRRCIIGRHGDDDMVLL